MHSADPTQETCATIILQIIRAPPGNTTYRSYDREGVTYYIAGRGGEQLLEQEPATLKRFTPFFT